MIISESCLTPRFLVGINDLITSTLSCPFTLSNIKAFPDKHSFQELDKTRPSCAWHVGPFYWTRVTSVMRLTKCPNILVPAKITGLM